jgi:putative DNA primase/helicase
MSEADFIDAMRSNGIEPHGELQLREGEIIRFRALGDKPGSRNAFAVFHSRPVFQGAYGSWRTGQTFTWRERAPVGETRAQRQERRRLQEEMRVQRLAEQAAVQASARSKAQRLLKLCKPATDAHPYLQTKAVHAYGLFQLREMLAIPGRDAEGTVHTVQFIGPDGTKRFLTGGRLQGCYFAIGKPQACIYLAEGYASAATVHEATGDAVAACFSAGNLKPVAVAIRRKFPALRLVIAADNDTQTPGNPGVRCAFEAAAAAGALVAVPDFGGATE